MSAVPAPPPTPDEVRKALERLNSMAGWSTSSEEARDLLRILRNAIEGPAMSLAPPVCGEPFPVDGFTSCQRPSGHPETEHLARGKTVLTRDRVVLWRYMP